MEYRYPGVYDVKELSKANALFCDDVSMAQQHFADECDINTIVKRFGISGVVPQSVKLPTFGDFSGVSDYQSALNAVMAAEDAFMTVPADIRAKFQNDPQAFVEFCSDSKNADELKALGLLKEAPAGEVLLDVSSPVANTDKV